MKFLKLLPLFLISFSSALYAQVEFSSLPGPNGGGVGDLEMNSSGNIFALVSDQRNSSDIPIAGNIYRSTNNGSSWTKLSGVGNLSTSDAYDIYIDPLDQIYILGKTKIYKSIDNGDTWTVRTPASPFIGGDKMIKTTDGDLFIVDISGGVFRSADDGATWANASNNLPGSTNYFGLANLGNDVYVGVNNSGTYKATNPSSGSPLWSSLNTGISLPNQANSFAVKGTTLYQSHRSGVSYLSGTTWIATAQDNNAALTATYIPDSFNSGDHQVINGSGNRMYIVFRNGKIYYSDNALTGPWTRLTVAERGDRIHALRSLLDNVFVGYGRNGIFASSNNAASFAAADKGINMAQSSSFVFLNSSFRFLVADGSSSLHQSDYGSNWEKNTIDPGGCTSCSVSSLIKLTNGNILAIGSETYRSLAADNGTNWTDIGGPSTFLQKVVTGNGSTTFFGVNSNGTTNTFYKSTNGAASFSTLTLTGPITTITSQARSIAADASNNLFIYVYSYTSGTGELYKVASPGAVSVKITNSTLTEVNSVRAFGGAIYAIGTNASNNVRIMRTTDGGTSWTSINAGDFYDVVPLSSEVFIGVERAGNLNKYYYSNDTGATWNEAFTESSNSQLIDGAIDDYGRAYVSLSNAPMYETQTAILRPDAPSNLEVIATGANVIELTWDHNKKYVDSFIVQRKLQSASTFVSVDTISSNLYYADEGLAEQTAYDYRVIAYSDAGSKISSNISATTKASCALTIPDNRSWTGTVAGGFSNATIAIRKVNASGYEITDFTAGSLNSALGQTTVSGFIYENCGQPFMGELDNRVHANGNGSWNGTNTIVLNFQLDKGYYTVTEKTITLVLNVNDPAPTTPAEVTAYTYDNTSIKVEWQPDYYDRKYIIHRSTINNFTPSAGTKVGEVLYPSTSFIDNTGLTQGPTSIYYYKIISENANAAPLSSAASAQATVTFNKPQFVPANNVIWNTNAGGATGAWADFNNDGLEDLLVPLLGKVNGVIPEPLLFQNTGSDFQIVTGKFPSGFPGVSPSVGDYDNDGLIDVFMTQIELEDDAATRYSLFKNTGSFNFTEQNNPVISQANEEGSFSSSWVDFNNDGKLDLFYINQEHEAPNLFQGDGAGGFTKVTTGAVATDVFNSSYASWADYDKNGSPDLLIITPEDYNSVSDAFRLFTNNNGTFTKVTGSVLDADDAQQPWGFSWGDMDNDLDLDLFAGNQSGGSLLYKNLGNGTFQKIATAAGTPTENPGSGIRSFGSAWGDIDNDGDLDLIVCRGFFAGTSVYKNDGSGNFTKVTGELLTTSPGLNFSASLADYDKNGSLDLFVGQLVFVENGPEQAQPNLKFLKNNNSPGNWVQVKLIGTISNKSAIGAKVVVRTTGRNQLREITSHTGFGGQSSLIAHFGLASATTINSIEITWPSGVVNTYTGKAVNQIYTFTEDNTGPVATVVSPLNNATDVAANSTVSITLNEASTPVAGKFLILYKHSDLSTPVDGIDVANAVKSGNTYTFTLASNLLASTQYNISVDAGAFKDEVGNNSLEFPTGLWTFTTASAPAAITLSPAHNATSIAAATPISITFNKNVAAVAGKKLKVMDGATAIVDIDVATTGTVSGATYSFTPANPLPNAKLLKVTVDAGAFKDPVGQTDFAGIAADSWNFTTESTPDIVAPVITFTPAAAVLKGFGTNSPTITVTDDRGTVSSVIVSIRKIGGTTYSDVTATHGTGDSWTFVISEASHFDDMGAEYFITAKDPANNSKRSPEGTATHKTFLTYSENDSKIPQERIGFGGGLSNWKIFAVPFDLGSNKSVTDVFNEVTEVSTGLENKIDYRFLTIEPANNTEFSEYPTGFVNINRGQGYFVNIKTAKPISIGAGLQAPANSKSNLFALNLKAGWNMIGNPYLSQISWENVAALNTLSGQAAELIKFNGSAYTKTAQTLEPYEGGLVFVPATINNVSIPFLGQTTSGGRKGYKNLGDDIDAEEWKVSLTLQQNEYVSDFGSVGMAFDATTGFDDYDGVTPPRFINYLEMNFPHPEFFAKRFTRDIVTTQREYTWDFTVDSNLQGDAQISWNSSNFVNATKEIFLLDVSRQKLIDMRGVSHYSFNPKESANFRIYFGENLKIAPEAVQLGKAYPNPSKTYTTIAFSLPDAGGPEQLVTLDVMDAMGRVVGTVTQGRFRPGFYETGFDARELNSGVFTYRLKVQGKNGVSTHVNKLIIK